LSIETGSCPNSSTKSSFTIEYSTQHRFASAVLALGAQIEVDGGVGLEDRLDAQAAGGRCRRRIRLVVGAHAGGREAAADALLEGVVVRLLGARVALVGRYRPSHVSGEVGA
jgi:hypothetical protein